MVETVLSTLGLCYTLLGSEKTSSNHDFQDERCLYGVPIIGTIGVQVHIEVPLFIKNLTVVAPSLEFCVSYLAPTSFEWGLMDFGGQNHDLLNYAEHATKDQNPKHSWATMAPQIYRGLHKENRHRPPNVLVSGNPHMC